MAAYQSFDAGAHWVSQTLTTLRDYDLTTDLAVRYADPGAGLCAAGAGGDRAVGAGHHGVAVRDLLSRSARACFSAPTPARPGPKRAAPNNSLTWPLALAFSPNDANTMYVGSNLVYRSTNAGQTWTTVSAGTHADNIAIAFTADRGPLIVSDGGIYAAPADSIALTVSASRAADYRVLLGVGASGESAADGRRHAGQRHAGVPGQHGLVVDHRWRRRRYRVGSDSGHDHAVRRSRMGFRSTATRCFQFYRCRERRLPRPT